MAYPTTLDDLKADWTDASDADANTSGGVGDHAREHNLAATAIEAVEGELGLAPSGPYATVRARLDALDMLVVSVKAHGATGDNSTDDRAAIQAALTAAAGGVVLFPAGTYFINVGTTELSVPSGTLMIGAGIGKTTLRFGPNGTTDSDISGIRLTGTESMEIRDMTLQAMTPGAGAGASGIQHTGTAGLVVARNVHFRHFQQGGLRASPGASSTASFIADSCIFEGDGTSGQGALFTSNGTGNRGKFIHFLDCRFLNFGAPASALVHGIYTYSDWDVRVRNCRFESSVGTGYGIQIFDSTVSAANASRNQLIEGCYFGTGMSANGIVVGGQGRARISNCVFENPLGAIRCGTGHVMINDCYFAGLANAANDFCISTSTGTPSVKVTGCRFVGTYNKHIAADGGRYEIIDCHFEAADATSQRYVSHESGSCVVSNCDFFGTVTSAHIRSTAGTRLDVRSNRFNTTGADCVWVPTGSTLSSINIRDNDFSQTAGNSVTFTVTPTTVERWGNYGTQGYGPRLLFGTGTPEAAVTAPVGSMFLRTDGAAVTTLYVKESGTGNTGWDGKD